ncbi:unnamed protein product, partial [Hapterophycus canaliculatus]
VSHRRRVGSRAGSQGRGVGSRAVGGGCSGSSEGHTYGCTTPAVSPEAGENSNGRSSRSSSSRSSSTTADASRGSVGGAAAAVATAPARSSYLASPEARARNRNHSEAEGADDNAAGEGGRTKQSRQQPPQGGRGEDSCRTSRSGDTQPEPLALPRARVLWRAFSEVDHEKIGENHRLAALSHQARFGPIPGVRNSPVCRVLV